METAAGRFRKKLLFDKNCHILILTQKEPFPSKGTTFLPLPTMSQYYSADTIVFCIVHPECFPLEKRLDGSIESLPQSGKLDPKHSIPHPSCSFGYVLPARLFAPLCKKAFRRCPYKLLSLPLTIPHCSRRAAEPVTKGVAMEVPLRMV